jgi:hypothetical protein
MSAPTIRPGVDGLGYTREQAMSACPPFCRRHDVHSEFGDVYHYGPEVAVPLSAPAAGLSIGVAVCRDDEAGEVGAPYAYLFHLDESFAVDLSAEQARQLALALLAAASHVDAAALGGAR